MSTGPRVLWGLTIQGMPYFARWLLAGGRLADREGASCSGRSSAERVFGLPSLLSTGTFGKQLG